MIQSFRKACPNFIATHSIVVNIQIKNISSPVKFNCIILLAHKEAQGVNHDFKLRWYSNEASTYSLFNAFSQELQVRTQSSQLGVVSFSLLDYKYLQ